MCQRIVQDRSIGGNLKKLRNREKLTQEQVAQKLQLMGLPVTREIYAQIETGRHHIPITVLLGMKKIFKADWDEMLYLADEEFF